MRCEGEKEAGEAGFIYLLLENIDLQIMLYVSQNITL